MSIKTTIRKALPASIWRKLHYIYNWILDVPHMVKFLFTKHPSASFTQKLGLLLQFFKTDRELDCAHKTTEILWFVDAILAAPKELSGDFAECGAFKGGSSAKFSLACKLAGRKLLIFDSFEGIPANDETDHATLDGLNVAFPEGSYLGGLDEVKANIEKCGDLSVCEFVKGFFDQTLPGRSDELAGIYLDVDLASSTKTCIEELFPKMSPSGWIMSQDGHLKLVLEVFEDQDMWDKLGVTKPHVYGFGQTKLIRMQKAST